MSTITGSCSSSEAQRLIERGFQDTQNARLQAAEQGTGTTIPSPGSGNAGGQGHALSVSPSGQLPVNEANKGEIIDLYA